MKIGLIDVDGHHYPNLPLMKLSAWHKQQGDSVEWYEPLLSGHMDIVYMAKVFSFTPDYEYFIDAEKIIRGGIGMNELLCRKDRKARKDHRCDLCGYTIKAGEIYEYSKNVYDGNIYEWHDHKKCSYVCKEDTL